MKRIKSLLLVFGLLVSWLVSTPLPVQAEEVSQNIFISEVQAGANGDVFDEFVELYNAADTPVDVSGWVVEFYSSSKNFPAATDTFPYPTATRTLKVLQGSIAAHSYLLLAAPNHYTQKTSDFFEGSSASSGYLAQAGYLRLANSAAITLDFLAWGSGTKQVDSWTRFTSIPDGQSVQRDFYQPEPYPYNEPDTATTPGLPLPLPAPLPQEESVCDGVVLSELLPNAAGSDSGHEFIEVHNPTAADINLHGCSLRLGDNGVVFDMPSENLPAGAYRAFSDEETNIVLPNQTATTVWLLSKTAEEGVLYAHALSDDQSWALFGGDWKATYKPTPGQSNQLVEDKPVEPMQCDQGQELNLSTNRCRTIANASSVTLAACKPGQERNPSTNRCRSISAKSPALVVCKVGQERNPATNRCRSVLSAQTTLKPCAAGQERNLATNRCRKINGSISNGQLAKIKETKSSFKADDPKWLIAGGAVVLALGYGLYEWRQECLRWMQRVMQHFRGRKMS